jgi:phenylacetate-CoA ligase
LVRNAILPLTESLLGRDTFGILRRLEADPNPDPTTLAARQAADLHALLNHAAENIPYWRERLHSLVSATPGSDPHRLLADVPVLTRAEIRTHLDRMRWAEAPGKVLVHRSGGTTDDNLTFYWNRLRQSWDRATRYRGWARLGVRPGDRVLHLWPRYPDHTRFGGLKVRLRDLRDWAVNDVVVDLRPFDPARLDAVLDYTAVYRPALVIGYPSWLTALADHVRATRPKFKLPSLRAVLSTGEVLYEFQRRTVIETFLTPVYQEYGSQDAGLIAHQDLDGVFRLNAEQMVVELLRGGRPAGPGEFGEVVVTHFFTPVMPFIRYATGDVARRPVKPSPAKPGLPPFPVPEGRASDLLLSSTGDPVGSRPVVDALVAEAGLFDFSLNQPEPGWVIVLEVVSESRLPARRDQARDVLEHYLGRPLEIDWRIGSGFEPFISGKRRYVCSPAALSAVAHDRESGMHRSRSWPQRLLVGTR